MAYKKKRGILSCVLTGFTPFWLDGINAKSGAECCVFLKYKMSEKMKSAIERSIENTERVHMMVERMPGDELHYKFMGFSGGARLGRQKQAERQIAYEALQHEINVDYNPARSRGNHQRLVTGRAGLSTFERTGNKIERAIRSRVDNSKELAEERAELDKKKMEKESKKQLTKLRRKYFYDRELQPNLSDSEWDKYLLQTYGEGFIPEAKNDSEFEAKLKESGLL